MLSPWQRLAAVLIFAALSVQPLAAASRVALVIGNANYPEDPLTSPVNDATDMAAALEALGFEVIVRTDLERIQLYDALDAFRRLLKTSREARPIALFFYAGHGLQAKGKNYLVPVNARIEGEHDIKRHSVALDDVLDVMQDGNAELGMVLLDACRDNPFEQRTRGLSSGRGLARVEATSSVLIGYSTAPGTTAQDSAGRNSPYTSVLKEMIGQPGLSVSDMLNAVGWEVKTRFAQEPWVSSSPIPRVCLAGCAPPTSRLSPQQVSSIDHRLDQERRRLERERRRLEQERLAMRARSNRDQSSAAATGETVAVRLGQPKDGIIQVGGVSYPLKDQPILYLPSGDTPFTLKIPDRHATLYGSFEVLVVDEQTKSALFGRSEPLFKSNHVPAALQGAPVRFTLGLRGSGGRKKEVLRYRLSLRRL